MMKHIYAFLCLFLLSGVVSADISGMALISDGDTIAISSMKVRLNGIDTPERNQTCRKAGVCRECGWWVPIEAKSAKHVHSQCAHT